MAMGIFEQLSWLTNKVKKLCCAIKVGTFQSRNISTDVIGPNGNYDITEGGIYQFYGLEPSNTIRYAYPTSVGQTIYIINVSTTLLVTSGLSPADRPFLGGEISTPMPDINIGEVWQLVSVDGTPFGAPGLIWRAYKLYPNSI